MERYFEIRRDQSDWLWLGSATKPFVVNGLRTMLQRRFGTACVKFKGTHAFRRGFAMEYLAAGGQEGDLKELGGAERAQGGSRADRQANRADSGARKAGRPDRSAPAIQGRTI
ncbi:MAG TPA: hypothetical protein EYM65_12365 [Dehalococcoidia bacterium]|nr:hypothetical protein [Dehalococcoidia bacterium]